MIYEYQCQKCNKIYEVELSIKDTTTEIYCDCCGKFDKKEEYNQECKCKRLISHSSFMLKGSGWAKDNYSSSKK